jgi:hypothetical protein
MPQFNRMRCSFLVPFVKISSAAILVIAANALFTTSANAQFSKPVVLLQGTVRSEETAKPTSVNVSVRSASDSSLEIAKSHSNSETGKYAVVLMPGKSYWVHLESDTTRTSDVLVTTPASDHTQKMEHDFTVELRDSDVRRKEPGLQ